MMATPPSRPLSAEELERYRRQLALESFGLDAQLKLRAARVLVVGLGGLGSPASLYLAAAGVGTLGIVDDDRVDVTNLHRQLLYDMRDVGRAKTDAAALRLRAVNPHVDVRPHAQRLNSDNALALFGEYDLVVDGTDNFATRYLVNDACLLAGIENVYGAVHRFDGQVSVLCAADGPCYRCLHPEPPPPETVQNCAEGGVLGVLPGLVGMLQATEAIKRLTGIGRPLVGRLLLLDTLAATTRAIRVPRNPACPACGTRTIQSLQDYEAWCAGPAHADTDEIVPTELAALLSDGVPLQLVDVREGYEWAAGGLPGARHVPLGVLPEVIGSLDPGARTVVYCRSGVRSASAQQQLRAAGFTRVRNLSGGVKRWARDVDPAFPVP